MEELLQSIRDLLATADNAGCSDDLTVVSQEALDALEESYNDFMESEGLDLED
jgi:hypothetical protein